MRIARVHIENYRSIKKLDIYPSNYCALIGENNAGKSNVLRAVNLVLGELWPTDRTFTQDDFYNQDTSRDIIIQVYFDEPIDAWRNMSIKVHGFELRGKAYKRSHRGMPKGTLAADYNCINASGETIKYPAEPLQEGKQARIWYDLKVSRELKEHLPFLYIDILRDYHRQEPGYRWSVLRKLLNVVNTELAHDKTQFKVLTPAGEEKMTRKEAFEYKLREAYNYLQMPELMEIEARINQNTRDEMGLDQEDISIHFAPYDPVDVYKNLQMFVEQMGISTSAERVGAGMQSAIVTAIFRTYEEMKKDGAVFAIEGPEMFMHPQKERYFHEVLHSISTNNQVFLTTHSREFLNIYHPEEVCLIRRNQTEGTKAVICPEQKITEAVKNELKLLNYFDTERNELFFAKGLILVAGSTEKHFISYIGHRLGRDLNRHGISVIDCGGSRSLWLYKQVADAFLIPCVSIIPEGFLDEEMVALIGPNGLFAIADGDRPGILWPQGIDELKSAMEYYDSEGLATVSVSLVQAIKTIIEKTRDTGAAREHINAWGSEGSEKEEGER